MKIVVRRGLTVPMKGERPVGLAPDPAIGQIGLAGADHPGLRAEMLVDEGTYVAQGATLYRDRRRPDVVFTAPVSGRVSEIAIGARRRMISITVAAEGEDKTRFETGNANDRDGLRKLLLASGLWPQFRTRPLERIPDPGAVPDAIFVTAMDTRSHAADPIAVLRERRESFSRGVSALALLTDGPVFVCQPDIEPLLSETATIKVVRFSGPHPAGLAGTHIAHLFPLAGQRKVWHIEAQDVAAIGSLLETGHADFVRTIALAGEGLRNPRLVRVPLGTDLHALVRSDLTPGQKRILSGPVLGGHETRYLSRYHRQASILDARMAPERNWLMDALHKAATVPAFIPTQALENAIGPDVPVVPLLRALSIGDAETARKLGCLALAEEDLALATYATGGAVDFGHKLRTVLDALEGEP